MYGALKHWLTCYMCLPCSSLLHMRTTTYVKSYSIGTNEASRDKSREISQSSRNYITFSWNRRREKHVRRYWTGLSSSSIIYKSDTRIYARWECRMPLTHISETIGQNMLQSWKTCVKEWRDAKFAFSFILRIHRTPSHYLKAFYSHYSIISNVSIVTLTHLPQCITSGCRHRCCIAVCSNPFHTQKNDFFVTYRLGRRRDGSAGCGVCAVLSVYITL